MEIQKLLRQIRRYANGLTAIAIVKTLSTPAVMTSLVALLWRDLMVVDSLTAQKGLSIIDRTVLKLSGLPVTLLIVAAEIWSIYFCWRLYCLARSHRHLWSSELTVGALTWVTLAHTANSGLMIGLNTVIRPNMQTPIWYITLLVIFAISWAAYPLLLWGMQRKSRLLAGQIDQSELYNKATGNTNQRIVWQIANWLLVFNRKYYLGGILKTSPNWPLRDEPNYLSVHEEIAQAHQLPTKTKLATDNSAKPHLTALKSTPTPIAKPDIKPQTAKPCKLLPFSRKD